MTDFSNEKSGLKKILNFVLIAFAFGIFASAGFDIAMRILTRTKKIVLVPNVIGMNVIDAMDVLQEKGLYPVKEKQMVADETVPRGNVVKQNPLPGSVVKKGRIVKLTLSEGGTLDYVPDLKNKTIQEAEILLTRSNLKLGNVSEIFNDEVKEGHIISQNPEAGDVAKPQTLIDVVVSKGPASLMGFLVMPYLVGKSTAQAQEILKSIGFEVSDVEYIINDNLKEGTIMKQQPPPGEILSEDAKIKFFASKHSEKETVRGKKFIYWEVPQDIKERTVKIVVKDATGMRKVYENTEPPGKKISLEVETIGTAEAIFYIDDVPVARKKL